MHQLEFPFAKIYPTFTLVTDVPIVYPTDQKGPVMDSLTRAHKEGRLACLEWLATHHGGVNNPNIVFGDLANPYWQGPDEDFNDKASEEARQWFDGWSDVVDAAKEGKDLW
jgi:hypothetical protein